LTSFFSSTTCHSFHCFSYSLCKACSHETTFWPSCS
jgi:hypothetical protein